MAYSVMIWLVDPASRSSGGEKQTGSSQGPAGVLSPPAFTHLSYGVFDSAGDAEEVMMSLSELLRTNAPLQLTHGSRSFLIPSSRVHYVVCEEVERPVD